MNRLHSIDKRLADQPWFGWRLPLQKGQLSCREVMNGERLTLAVQKDQPLMIDALDSPYARVESLKQEIYKRGL